MSEINITNTAIYFTDSNNTKKVLLDLQDFLKNKSRIPMHSISKENDIIPNFLAYLISQNRDLLVNKPFDTIRNIATTTLAISRLIDSAAPFQIAEYGCTKGDLSYNLAETLYKFNPKSLLCLISDTIGNDSGNKCLDFITKVTALPEISMVYSDYNKTIIGDNTFDIVILNGNVKFENHYKVIKEAERITKKNGFIICNSCGDYLLESTFKLIFSEREEYTLSASDVILTTVKTEDSWENITGQNVYTGCAELIENIKHELRHDADINLIRKYIRDLDEYVDLSIKNYDVPSKLHFIQLKETLTDYINNLQTEFKEYYKEQFFKFTAES